MLVIPFHKRIELLHCILKEFELLLILLLLLLELLLLLLLCNFERRVYFCFWGNDLHSREEALHSYIERFLYLL